ncbi:unnamed protein product [Moneuplotes crassus]|uniref:Uncharacterized protein n=1 Tax=Euplotes crassus TaxID=5936 RepID=A0AAD1Y1Y2_EUPCR|nr:unnamed protein product [Moneuplotes crassus]
MNKAKVLVGPKIQFTFTGLRKPYSNEFSFLSEGKLPSLNRRPLIDMRKRRELVNKTLVKIEKQRKFMSLSPKSPNRYFKKDLRPPKFFCKLNNDKWVPITKELCEKFKKKRNARKWFQREMLGHTNPRRMTVRATSYYNL